MNQMLKLILNAKTILPVKNEREAIAMHKANVGLRPASQTWDSIILKDGKPIKTISYNGTVHAWSQKHNAYTNGSLSQWRLERNLGRELALDTIADKFLGLLLHEGQVGDRDYDELFRECYHLADDIGLNVAFGPFEAFEEYVKKCGWVNTSFKTWTKVQ
jgi:hypothetical protein